MPNIINCPGCGRQLRLPETLLGQDVQCPTCQKTFTANVNLEANPIPPPVPPVPTSSAVPSAPLGEETYGLRPKEELPEDLRPRRRRRDWGEDEDEGDFDDDYRPRSRKASRRASAQAQVAGPAIGLMVVGGLGLAMACINMGLLSVNNDGFNPQRNSAEAAGYNIGRGIGVLVSFAWGILILAGAFQMYNLRGFGLSMAASIVAMVPCNLCCVLGLPFGIWALIVLLKPEVKDAFT